jgi:hypothetical protein
MNSKIRQAVNSFFFDRVNIRLFIRKILSSENMAAAPADDACPPAFIDPVTFECMRDPVMTVDGHTFEVLSPPATSEKHIADHA